MVCAWGNSSLCFSKPFIATIWVRSQLQHIVRYTMKIKWRQKKFLVVFFVCHQIWSDGVSSAPTFSNNLFEGSWPVMHVKLASSSRQFGKSNIFPSGLIRAVSKCCYAEWSLTQHEHHHVTRIMSLRPDGAWGKLCCVAVISLLVLYLMRARVPFL